MEGAGSRLGRASSRYGPTTTVFNGPVRKWKKKWVHVSSSSSSNLSYNSNGSRSTNNNKNSSSLLLCRWTPIPSTTNTAANNSDKPVDPPRRKCRYAPIVALEEKKKDVAKKIDDEAKISMTGSLATGTSESDDPSEKPFTKRASSEEVKVANKKQFKPGTSNRSHLNFDLELQGHGENDDDDSDGGNKKAEVGNTSVNPSEFWA